MSIKLTANINNPPISGLATAHLINETIPVEITWGNETSLVLPDNQRLVCYSNNDVLRALSREAPQYKLYGETAIERTQIDHWLSFSLTCDDDISWAMSFLDKSIAPVTFLVANKLTIADFALFNEMHSRYEILAAKGIPVHVQRWYDLINAQPMIQKVLQTLPDEARVKSKVVNKAPSKERDVSKPGERKQEGKFVDLPGAEMGKVIVRFPPEASGYLHIGHAKAALLNQYYQQAFNGKLIMRFDDTNPAKETVEFEQVILEDLEMLQIKPDLFTHTSNYFDLMLEYCEKLIKEGKAYVDDTDPETMKKERELRMESNNRTNDVNKNMAMWKEMLNGSAAGQKCCVRAKIDMSSANGCMRDPTIYRCKNEPHPRTGTKYKVYPTYDFACPIVDAIENVTHTLRTMEYHDRDDQFYWFIEALNLRKPYIWEYSRLNMTNTVLSKRKLTWFVDQGLVDGWDDPRFPTVRGILRRGMTVEGLKEFIIAQGSSKSVVFMNWDKIWAFNKKVIDPIAPRYTALEASDHVLVNVAGAKNETIEVPAHPKNESVGKKTIALSDKILIDNADAVLLKEGENATFINWGNLLINKINKVDGKITSIDAKLNLENKDFKKTQKLTWLAKLDSSEYPPTFCVYFDNIISKPVLGKDEDFKQYIGHQTRSEIKMLGDPELKKCKKGDIIQLQRRGFFKVDNAYAPPNPIAGVTSPIILFSIPDGHTKDVPTSGLKVNGVQESSKNTPSKQSKADKLNVDIVKQSLHLRDLLYQKADPSIITVAENKLLSLRTQFKAITGEEWKVQPEEPETYSEPWEIDQDPADFEKSFKQLIAKQENFISELEEVKTPKSRIDLELSILESHKQKYKELTGKEWKHQSDDELPPYLEKSELTVSEIDDLIYTIAEEHYLIPRLHRKKAAKERIQHHEQIYSKLKGEYKKFTGEDWTPDTQTSRVKNPPPRTTTNLEVSVILKQIEEQAKKIEDLASQSPPMKVWYRETKQLQALKIFYRSLTDTVWTPFVKIPLDPEGATVLLDKIRDQNEKIQKLKDEKAPKSTLKEEVKILAALKEEYDSVYMKLWIPDDEEEAAKPSVPHVSNTSALLDKIKEQGDKIRKLKSEKAQKSVIEPEVKTLLALKTEYKSLTGKDWTPDAKAETVSSPATACADIPTTSNASSLLEKIKEQGDKIRKLKSEKAPKATIESEVKTLLALKTEYKSVTGKDWTPDAKAETVPSTVIAPADTPSSASSSALLDRIKEQGDKIRKLKSEKAQKATIEPEVKTLLALKGEYKSLTGKDWTPDAKPETVSSSATVSSATAPVDTQTTSNASGLLDKIKEQGDKIRKLKSEKAPKATIEPEVKILLALKTEYKSVTGKDWTPDAKPETQAPTETMPDEKEKLTKEINAQGDKIRSLKSSQAAKDLVEAEVKILLELKAKYKEVTGTDFPVAARGSSKKETSAKLTKPAKKEAPKPEPAAGAVKKQTRLGLEATKEENLPEWYSQVITKGELIEYYDVSGCYILRHWSFAIWKFIKNWFDAEITKMGVKECYFPIFVSKAALEKEKTHIADFAPEVAWVTKSGESDLAEPIAVRPTSETVMYPAYAKWIQSYRDLPLRLNQWNNVVRWEFKHPQPFLRTREFLWQEGHTAFATKEEADKEVLEILDLYAQVYTNLMAIPVVKGRKTEKEKFAGGDYTTTVEAFISASGRAIQGATSHHLGQNFSKMFEIVFEDPETQKKQYAYQNSWGITTRTIGVMIMIHADNQGIVLPPHVACIQAIIVPCGITVNTKDDERELLLQSCKSLEKLLNSNGIRCEGDYRDNYSPGWKFNHWELKGVPIRIEIGPKDMKANQMVAVRRDTGEKLILSCENAEQKISQLLETIHESMYAKAKVDLTEHTKQTKNWSDFCKFLDQKNILLAPFCGEIACEDQIKADSARDEDAEPGAPAMGAKSLCIPFDQPAPITAADKCIHPNCSKNPKYYCLFGRSY